MEDDVPLEACYLVTPLALTPTPAPTPNPNQACVPAPRRTPPPLPRPGSATGGAARRATEGYVLAGREMHRLRGAADTAAAVKQDSRPEAVAGVLQLERQRPSSCYDAHDAEVAGLLACWAGGLLHAARAYESSVEQAPLPSCHPSRRGGWRCSPSSCTVS